MKFGQTLLDAAGKRPEWVQYFVAYRRLKSLITSMAKVAGDLSDEASAAATPLPAAHLASVAAIVHSLEVAFEALLESVRGIHVRV